MTLTIDQHHIQDNELEVHVEGKLTREDYRLFVPEIETLIEKHGKLRILFDMKNFHGWDMTAIWEDIKFDIHHFGDLEKIAMVGEKKWQEWMSQFCKPFTKAEIRYFQSHEIDQARAWLRESKPAAAHHPH